MKGRILIISALISFLSLIINYEFLIHKKKRDAANASDKVKSVLSTHLDYASNIALFSAKEIAKDSNYKDLNKIYQIFTRFAKTQSKDSTICWSFLDWVDRSNLQVVNTVKGVNTTNPTNMAKLGRKYNWHLVQEPWKMKFSEPALGTPSNTFNIPAGLWAEENGNYIGAVALGIEISKLTAKINSQLENHEPFMIIDANSYKFVFNSEDFIKTRNSSKIMKYEKWAEIASKKELFSIDGFFESSLNIEDDNYIYSQKLGDHYPYIILTGYDRKSFWQEIIRSTLIIFLQSIGISWLVIYAIKNRST